MSRLIVYAYEPDNLGGVFLQCRREGVDERVPLFPVHFGKWGIYRGAHSRLDVKQAEIPDLRKLALAYLTNQSK